MPGHQQSRPATRDLIVSKWTHSIYLSTDVALSFGEHIDHLTEAPGRLDSKSDRAFYAEGPRDKPEILPTVKAVRSWVNKRANGAGASIIMMTVWRVPEGTA